VSLVPACVRVSPIIREEDRRHSLQVQIAVLAHAVTRSATGNITVHDVFNGISATAFPTSIPKLTMLVRVHYGASSGSSTPKQTIYRFSDADGPSHEFRLDAWFPPPPNGSMWAVSDNSVVLDNFPIEAPGDYWFEFWVDGHQLCTLPLTVAHVTPDQRVPGGTPSVPAQ
jgi:hypothetical protein